MTDPLKVGILVEHPNMPEWGPGKILEASETKLAVYFRDAARAGAGNPRKLMSRKHVDLVVAANQTDPILDAYKEAPPKAAGRKRAPKVPVGTLDDGIALFQAQFPDGFRSPAFIGDEKLARNKVGERAYKLAAGEPWRTAVQSGEARKQLEAGLLQSLTDKLLAANAGTNLLFPMEKSALIEGLKDEAAARKLYGALLDLIEADETSSELLEAYFEAVCALPHAEGKASAAKWPVATFLPYFADHTRFMFLKPKATQECAARMGFDLGYSPTPNAATFLRLMDMSEQLLEKLKPLGAEDYIDVQSFVFVVHAATPKPAAV